MTEFTSLKETNIQLDYGRFIEVAVKQGEKAVFLRLAGGELYLDQDGNNGKRYNKGWISLPIGAVERVAMAMIQTRDEYMGSFDKAGKQDEIQAQIDVEGTEKARRGKKKAGGKVEHA